MKRCAATAAASPCLQARLPPPRPWPASSAGPLQITGRLRRNEKGLGGEFALLNQAAGEVASPSKARTQLTQSQNASIATKHSAERKFCASLS
jgi:hypothetical protein